MTQTTPPLEYNRPRRVYITNYGYHDYTGAKKFGELHAITRGRVDFRFTDRWRNTIVENLREMQPEDFICISGPAIIATEVAAVVMQKFGVVNYIYYEHMYGKYLSRSTDGTTREIGEHDNRELSTDVTLDDD